MTNAILLPKVMAYNRKGAPEKFAEIAEALGVEIKGMSAEDAAMEAEKRVKDLAKEIGIPDTLDDFGVSREMFPKIVEGTMDYRLLWMNPLTFTEEMAYQILEESLSAEKA